MAFGWLTENQNQNVIDYKLNIREYLSRKAYELKETAAYTDLDFFRGKYADIQCRGLFSDEGRRRSIIMKKKLL